MICEDCKTKEIMLGVDGVCVCGKTVCYQCFCDNHKKQCYDLVITKEEVENHFPGYADDGGDLRDSGDN